MPHFSRFPRSSRLVFAPGRIAEFEYPARNRLGVPLEFRRRRILVESVRRLSTDPLSPADFLRRPLVRRGSALIRGVDLDIGEPRHFYLEAVRECRLSLPAFRLGLYDPCAPQELVDWVGRWFAATPHDRAVMSEAIAIYNRWVESVPDLGLCLAVYPVAA